MSPYKPPTPSLPIPCGDPTETTGDPTTSTVGAGQGLLVHLGQSFASHRKLELVKKGHRYVFEYTLGEECKLLGNLINMARDPKCPLNMFDAAVLSHQMGRGLEQGLDERLRSNHLTATNPHPPD